jgi:predicted RNA-binding protein
MGKEAFFLKRPSCRDFKGVQVFVDLKEERLHA